MDGTLADYALRAVEHAGRRGAIYCDVRAEDTVRDSVRIEDGALEHSEVSSDRGLGIRILRGASWGFCSVSDPDGFAGVRDAVDAAIYGCAPQDGGRVSLAAAAVHSEDVSYPVVEEPDRDQLVSTGLECDTAIRSGRHTIKSVVSLQHRRTSKIFASSEGSRIVQEYSDVVAWLTAVARDGGTVQSTSSTEGGRGGMEALLQDDAVFTSAARISERASGLVRADTVGEERATVVMNPDFAALLVHEILGHPSEADRVLGREMAWAGGSWWAGRLGRQVGSESLSVFDDPTIPGGLGWYEFDDEGTRAARTDLVSNGILQGHLHSRETAAEFGAGATANMRSESYRFMPLIRMACTCIGPGDWDPEEIIGDVRDGYYIADMRVPSIDHMRYNWSISCQYAQKIEDGELGRLCRDVIVTGTAPEFFESIDACGRDFAVRPITNCGKGDPMQSLAMGNGGPTIRGTAIVRGVAG